MVKFPASRPFLPPRWASAVYLATALTVPVSGWTLRHQREGLIAGLMWLGWAGVSVLLWYVLVHWLPSRPEASS